MAYIPAVAMLRTMLEGYPVRSQGVTYEFKGDAVFIQGSTNELRENMTLAEFIEIANRMTAQEKSQCVQTLAKIKAGRLEGKLTKVPLAES